MSTRYPFQCSYFSEAERNLEIGALFSLNPCKVLTPLKSASSKWCSSIPDRPSWFVWSFIQVTGFWMGPRINMSTFALTGVTQGVKGSLDFCTFSCDGLGLVF